MASVDTQAIEGEVDRIRSFGLEDLRREWRRLNHAEPPRISRDLLVLALGYRLQGTHTVTVTEDGFEYAGTSYPSLTKIAKKITGAHWSGPRFFALPAAGAERPRNGRSDG